MNRERNNRVAEMIAGLTGELVKLHEPGRQPYPAVEAVVARWMWRAIEVERELDARIVESFSETNPERAIPAAAQEIRFGQYETVAQGGRPTPPNDIVERLRGVYRVPVLDGCGRLNGADEVVRRFPTNAIQNEAAEKILQLRAWRDETSVLLREVALNGADVKDRRTAAQLAAEGSPL